MCTFGSIYSIDVLSRTQENFTYTVDQHNENRANSGEEFTTISRLVQSFECMRLENSKRRKKEKKMERNGLDLNTSLSGTIYNGHRTDDHSRDHAAFLFE